MKILPVIFGRASQSRALGLGLLLGLSIHSMAVAQAPSTAPSSGDDLAASLKTIPGVEAGMSVESLLDLAAKATQDGRFPDAQTILDTVIARDHENRRALSLLAVNYERQALLKKNSTEPGDAAKSDALLQKAIDVYLVLAPLKLKAGEKHEAENLFTRILTNRANEPTAQLALARLLAATDRPVVAIERYQEYVRNPAAPPDMLTKAHIELGQLYRKSKMPGQAIASLNNAMKLNPEIPDIYIELARALQATNSLEKAKNAAAMALGKSPENPEYHDVMSNILLAQEKLPEAGTGARRAIDLARAALSKQPDQEELWRSLNGFYTTYERVLRTMMAKGSDTAAVRVDLVHALQDRAGVSDVLEAYQALEMLQNTPAAEKKNARLLEAMADLQATLFKLDDATATCRRLLEIDPNNATATRILQNLSQQLVPTTQSVANVAPATLKP